MAEPNHRPREEVLADAIGVLTEAARLRRPVLQRTESGAWQPDPTRTEQADWAEFVSEALAGAAANVRGVAAILAGRPGSWEADGVRSLLLATVGHDEAHLYEHRTEPLRVVAPVEQILADHGLDELYEALHVAVDVREVEALGAVEDDSAYLWCYERSATGEFVSSDPQAPPWSIEAWRDDRVAEGYRPEQIAKLERTVLTSPLTQSVYIAKSPQARAAVQRLDAQRTTIADAFRRRHEALDEQRREDQASYGKALAEAIRERAASLYPGVAVEVDATDNPIGDLATDVGGSKGPAVRLVEYARKHTRWPRSDPGLEGRRAP